jgi:Tol biopolymer transport system component
MSETPTANDRLDSRKEIAAYLKRNERTVSRWEKRGLPVHRIPGGRKQMVFAYKHELDAWLKEGQETSEFPGKAVESPQDAIAGAVPITQPSTRNKERKLPLFFHRRGFIIFAPCLVLAMIGTITILQSHSTVSAVVRVTHLDRLTDEGRHKTNLRTDGQTLYFNEIEVNREILVSVPISGGQVSRIKTPFKNVDLQDVSNDGRNLLVTSFEGMERGGRPLWTIPASGGTPQRVGQVLCHLARWSPDNRRIACANDTSISILDVDGASAHLVGVTAIPASALVWVPDGKKLRVTLMDRITRELTAWEIAADSNGLPALAAPSPLPLGKDCCFDWNWTRNSKDFVYTRLNADLKPSLYVQQNGRKPEHAIKVSDIDYIAPGKTDRQMYVLVASGYHGELLKFDSKRKVFQVYLQGLSANCLSFSPDGHWMTYVVPATQSLWLSRTDGSNAVQLTKPPFEAEYSSWSPDGNEIAFMGKRPGQPWRVFLMDRRGGPMKEAAHGSDNQGAPTWSSDGGALSYGNIQCEETQSCWIRRIDLATGIAEPLSGSYGFRSARWSPDGRFIAALQPQTHELMLFDVKREQWKTLANGITGDCPNWSHDSRFIYVDSIEGENPVIVRIRVSDGEKITVASLAGLKNIRGELDFWMGFTPDDSPILLHLFSASEIYALEWTFE